MNSTRVFFVIVPSRFTVYSTFCLFLYRMPYGSVKESVHSKAILSTKKWLFNYSFSASQITVNRLLSYLFPSIYYSSDNKTSYSSSSINNSYAFLNSFNKTLYWILIQNINASKNKDEKSKRQQTSPTLFNENYTIHQCICRKLDWHRRASDICRTMGSFHKDIHSKYRNHSLAFSISIWPSSKQSWMIAINIHYRGNPQSAPKCSHKIIFLTIFQYPIWTAVHSEWRKFFSPIKNKGYLYYWYHSHWRVLQ